MIVLFDCKVVFIIGVSCGIGCVIVVFVVECGWDVGINYVCDVVVVELIV